MKATLFSCKGNLSSRSLGNVQLSIVPKSYVKFKAPAADSLQNVQSDGPVLQLAATTDLGKVFRYDLSSCCLFPDTQDGSVVHIRSAGSEGSNLGDALQFGTADAACKFLRSLLRQCQPGSDIDSLNEQTGPPGGFWNTKQELLTVERSKHPSSSTHSNASELSHSAGSSGYCSYGWSDISTSSSHQLVSADSGGGGGGASSLAPNHPPQQGPTSEDPDVAAAPAAPATRQEEEEEEEGFADPVRSLVAAGDHTLAKTALIVKTGESSAPVQRGEGDQQEEGRKEEEEEFETVEVKEELRAQRCRYCNKTYDFGEEVPAEERCRSAPNKLRESLDRFICIQCYKGAWYHLTKDALDEEGQDIGRCQPGNGMTTGHWCLLGMLSVICAPCLVLWCPLSICELAAQQAGVTGGPHNMTTVKKKTTIIPTKRRDEDTTIVHQPVRVEVTRPPGEEDEEEEEDSEEEELARMMGYTETEEEGTVAATSSSSPPPPPPGEEVVYRPTGTRGVPRVQVVQRAQSEIQPGTSGGGARATSVQRSMSETRS